MKYNENETMFAASMANVHDAQVTKKCITDHYIWFNNELKNLESEIISSDMSNIKELQEKLKECKEAIKMFNTMPKPNEFFVPLNGYDGYEISNWARVRNSETMEVQKPTINNCYYLYVFGTELHRLMASSFSGETANMEVDHVNGIKFDDRLENLQWLTREENQLKSKQEKKKKEDGRKKSVVQYTLNGEKVAEYRSISDAVKINGWKQGINGGISRACRTGIDCKGFYWRYA